MKLRYAYIIMVFIPYLISAQSVSPEVIASSGDYYEGANVSLSWTLGEIMTETYTNGDITITQGFQQPFHVKIVLDISVFLEGPYADSEMNTNLNDEGIIPINQPFNVPPWNYSGDESVVSIPNNEVVDWVLIELRDANNAASATPSSQLSQQVGWLLKDGTVTGIDGTSTLSFNNSFSENLYIVVWHRNHLGIMSANQPIYTNGIYTYDFSSNLSQVYGGGAGYKLINTGVYGMVGGDANNDGLINETDMTSWASEAGKSAYTNQDFNLDTQVSNQDKNDVWVENQTYSDQVPD